MSNRYNTGNSRPSNSMKDLNDNALAYDDFMLSEEGTFVDRLGNQVPTLKGLSEIMSQAGESVVEKTRQNLTPLSRQYMTLAAAQADIANIPEGSTTYYRSPDDDALAIEVINNSGTLEATGRRMPSEQTVIDTITLASLTKKDATESGIACYDGDGLYPIAVDRNDRLLVGYNQGSDSVVGVGLDIDRKLTESGVAFYDESGGLHPVVVGDGDKVLLGYNQGSDSVIGVGLDTKRKLTEAGLSKYYSDSIYPICVDIDGKVILGYDANKDKLIGVIDSGGTVYRDSPFPYKMVAAAINYFITYGQSLSTGHWGLPVLSVSQPYSNITFAGGVHGGSTDHEDYSSFIPLVENTASFEANDGETPCSGAANFATLLANVENGIPTNQHVILSSAPGHGAYRIAQLSKGTPWYNTHFMKHLTSAKSLSSSLGVQAIMWIQGESDSGVFTTMLTREQYLTAFLTLVADINTDAIALTGQTSPVVFLSYQHSSYVTKSDGATQLAMLDAQRQSDLVYVITPTYHLPHHTDNLHLSAVGYKWMGAYFGRAYKQMMHDGIKPRAIHPISAMHAGNIVRVRFSVPVMPLVFDTVNLINTKDFGFVVTMNGVAVNINNIYIENGDTVVIEANGTLSGVVMVRYALDNNGTTIVFGASGNLRDSCPDSVIIDGIARTLHYMSPHFELTSVSGVI
ncbi:sialate O-acetylesterase [Raoultella planticola]|uniref:sialate O-acetylesterase n=2 Tax=Raoultella planticola TaxID=575 RepID=UPI00292BD7D2|nr:sialate O-acetylesterase [Raoultella planticola]MDV1446361.1 sialate O-acetylesterase [Raoultella planticola]MDV1565324.1 sialate O-acetylesterase [Raoultella planticola]MDV1632184.1 sialate O-acetylesterase [Raoultella planticola]MDW2729726.1 sialate O-acetylesterase [Raoultella planticola]